MLTTKMMTQKKQIAIGLLALLLLWFYCSQEEVEIIERENNLLLLTVATVYKSSVRRFQRSAQVNGLPFKILGLGTAYEGFGHKINIVIKELELHKDDSRKIILFADAHDVLINSNSQRIVDKFKRFNSRIVFSAEGNCWPDASLGPLHPPVTDGKRYLNSGLYIGYAPDVYRLLTYRPIANSGNDQLHFIHIYINETSRKELDITLDHRSEMFQNLFQALNDVELRFTGEEAYVQNIVYGTSPLLIHANGLIKQYVDTLGNYIPKAWNLLSGCTACLEDTIDLSKFKQVNEYPSVLIGIFIKKDQYADAFLSMLTKLSYPKDKIGAFLYSNGNASASYLDNYSNITRVGNVSDATAKNLAIEECQKRRCDYYFHVESDVQLDNPRTLQLLIEQNRPVVAPMLQESNGDRTNFRGAQSPEFYPPSMDILENNRKGLWKVPHISSCYLVKGDIIQNPETKPSYGDQDPDSSFCAGMRLKDVDMFVSNRFEFGRFRQLDETSS